MSEIAKNRLFAGFIVFYIITAAALPNSGVAWSQNQTPLPKLMEDLKNPSAHVRVNALYAIGNMGPEAKDAVPALIEAMHSSDTLRPRQIMSVLIKIGPNAKAAIPALKAKMNSDDSQLRIAAAGTMLAIDPTKRELYPVLTAALENKNDHQIADTARSVLYQIGQESEATVHSLIRALKIESSGTRRQAAKLLKPMVRRTDIVEPAFIQVLDDDDLHVRLTAVTALKENVFSSKAVVPALVRSLDDSALEVRRAAVTALKFAPFAALIPEAEHAVPALIRALTDDTPEVRRTAVSILQRMGPNAKAAVPALIELLDDDNIKLRVHAAIALVYIDAKTHAALPVLLEGLGSSWMEFRIESIIRAIGRMGPDAKEATVGLLYYTDDGYYNRSSEVKKALDQIGPAAVPYLIESLDNEGFATPLPRRTAVEYLAKYGPETSAALPDLIAIFQKARYKGYAAQAIGNAATLLQDAKAKEALADLKTAHKLLATHPNFDDPTKQVRRAIDYLEAIRQPWWKHLQSWMVNNPKKSMAAGAYVCWVLVWLMVFWLRPITLLRSNYSA